MLTTHSPCSASPAVQPPQVPAFDPLGRAAASPGAKTKKNKAGSAGQAVDRIGGDPSSAGPPGFATRKPCQLLLTHVCASRDIGAAQRPFAAEDVQATLEALEAQTRVTTGAGAGGPAAGGLPDALLQDLEGLDEESYQALLREVRRSTHRCVYIICTR